MCIFQSTDCQTYAWQEGSQSHQLLWKYALFLDQTLSEKQVRYLSLCNLKGSCVKVCLHVSLQLREQSLLISQLEDYCILQTVSAYRETVLFIRIIVWRNRQPSRSPNRDSPLLPSLKVCFCVYYLNEKCCLVYFNKNYTMIFCPSLPSLQSGPSTDPKTRPVLFSVLFLDHSKAKPSLITHTQKHTIVHCACIANDSLNNPSSKKTHRSHISGSAEGWTFHGLRTSIVLHKQAT